MIYYPQCITDDKSSLPKNVIFFCTQFLHYVEFYFPFRQLIGFPVWGQLCSSCQGEESSTFFSGNIWCTLHLTLLHVSIFGVVFIVDLMFIVPQLRSVFDYLFSLAAADKLPLSSSTKYATGQQMTAMSTFMPIFLLYSFLLFAHGCVYTCTVPGPFSLYKDCTA